MERPDVRNFVNRMSYGCDAYAEFKDLLDSWPCELVDLLGKVFYRGCTADWIVKGFMKKLALQSQQDVQATCEILLSLDRRIIFASVAQSEKLLEERLIVAEDYEPKPKDIPTEKFFIDTFNSFELECAAGVVVELCKVVGGWMFADKIAREMIPNGSYELLAQNGWIHRDPRNRGIWRVTKGFVDRCDKAAKKRQRSGDTTFMDRKKVGSK